MAEAARREDWPRTVAEFEAWHARQPERWEFIDGQPRLMAPGLDEALDHQEQHRLRSMSGPGGPGLRGADRRSPDPAAEISAIPDVVVTCSAIDLSTPVIAEPVIIVEVMPPSSEADDAGRKWFSYRKTSSLKHYLVLSQDQRVVQVHSRSGDLWRERFVSSRAIELDDPSVPLNVDVIYAGTEIAA